MDKPSSKITILLFLIVFIGASIGFYCYFNLDSGRIPSEGSVVSMTGSLYNRPDSGVDIDEFTIPPDHYEAILNLFQNAQPDSNPAKWQVLGAVKIRTVFSTTTVSLFWTDETEGAFRTAPSNYFRGSSDKEIIDAIVKAKADSKD